MPSNREGGYGDLDLYYFDLPRKFRPLPVTYMKGTLFDDDTKKPLGARFELIDLATGDTAVTAYSDRINGDFLVILPANRNYALSVSKERYLFHSENFRLDNNEVTAPYIKNIYLKPLKIEGSVVLRNIFFDTDKFDLKEASLVELNRLKQLLDNNPSMEIEIGGHTR